MNNTINIIKTSSDSLPFGVQYKDGFFLFNPTTTDIIVTCCKDTAWLYDPKAYEQVKNGNFEVIKKYRPNIGLVCIAHGSNKDSDERIYIEEKMYINTNDGSIYFMYRNDKLGKWKKNKKPYYIYNGFHYVGNIL